MNCEEYNQMVQNTDVILETKNGFIDWVKAHKKQLIAAGVGIISIIGIILGLKNKDALEVLWASLAERIKKVPSAVAEALPATPVVAPVLETVTSTRTYTPPTEAFDVSRHIRTMSAGRHHSAGKAVEAAALGIELLPNQTLVDAYTKGAA